MKLYNQSQALFISQSFQITSSTKIQNNFLIQVKCDKKDNCKLYLILKTFDFTNNLTQPLNTIDYTRCAKIALGLRYTHRTRMVDTKWN